VQQLWRGNRAVQQLWRCNRAVQQNLCAQYTRFSLEEPGVTAGLLRFSIEPGITRLPLRCTVLVPTWHNAYLVGLGSTPGFRSTYRILEPGITLTWWDWVVHQVFDRTWHNASFALYSTYRILEPGVTAGLLMRASQNRVVHQVFDRTWHNGTSFALYSTYRILEPGGTG
jgi:hypothetical protein